MHQNRQLSVWKADTVSAVKDRKLSGERACKVTRIHAAGYEVMLPLRPPCPPYRARRGRFGLGHKHLIRRATGHVLLSALLLLPLLPLMSFRIK